MAQKAQHQKDDSLNKAKQIRSETEAAGGPAMSMDARKVLGEAVGGRKRSSKGTTGCMFQSESQKLQKGRSKVKQMLLEVSRSLPRLLDIRKGPAMSQITGY